MVALPDHVARGRAEVHCLHEMPLMVERRSLRSGLRPSVETTESTRCGSPAHRPNELCGDVRRRNMGDTPRQAATGAKRMRLIGVDVGGTFTDLVYADTDAGATAVHKISTTPDDPSRAVVQGLMALCDKSDIPRETIDVVFHGTTIATNSILEHDGAVTGMITTGGYRDILHIGRHQPPQRYSIMPDITCQS